MVKDIFKQEIRLRLFKALVLLVSIIILGCVGTKDEDLKVAYSAEPYLSDLSCDERGECFGNCLDCAVKDECKTQNSACEGDSECTTLRDCIKDCDEDEVDKCHDACVSHHGVGNDTFLELWSCVYCDVCVDSCSKHSLSCESYENYTPDTTIPDYSGLTWSSANLTYYESYPEPDSRECIEFSGCDYVGQFNYFSGVTKSEAWVEANNIIAIHSKDYSKYKGKTLRVRIGENQVDGRVYDMCSDADCDGCCTRNAEETGFLIDLEINTFNRLTSGWSNTVEWACLDCE